MTDAYTRLAAAVECPVHRPGDPGHQHARKMFIGRPDEHVPQAVVACASESDVAAALAVVREARLPFAVRGGGHSFAEHSTSPGVVIDLGGLKGITRAGERVTVAAGTRVGELADHLAPDGLVVPVGWCRSVGVIGAVLGGGYGVLGRYYGLGSDHLLSATVLLADGSTITTSADEHPDLFWALRGAGGGSFGIVLSAVLRTRPAVPLTAVRASWPHEHIAEVIDRWQHTAPTAPREVNLELSVYAGDFTDEPPVATLFGVVVGEHPVLNAFPPPATADTTHLDAATAAVYCDYPGDVADHTLARLPDGERPALRLTRASYFPGPIHPDAIRALTTHLTAARVHGVYRELELIPWGAALAEGDGPAAHRDQSFLVKHTVQTGTRASDPLRAGAARWLTTSAATLPGPDTGYANYPDSSPDPHRFFGPSLPRLHAIKATYDPDGTFRSGLL